ncbi:MAG: RNA 2',3'-cyclic phosphodiesterase [Ignavibacteriae bacterium]|nr:RNA 2',3'-cyclic phosphodiesterase [Ignavibacteriota bacterium]
MSSIRSFIALPASDVLREKISRVQQELQQGHADVRWELPGKFHITLKFLGNVELQVLEKLMAALSVDAARHPAFELVYQGVGAFPDVDKPRVVWVGTNTNDVLISLQQSVEKICEQFGFAREGRAFHPHITLGRVKSTRNIQRLTEKLKKLTFDPTNFLCAELLVMRSTLHPSGSEYSVVKSIPLKPL